MNIKRKFFSITLALVLCIALAVPTFATDIQLKAPKTVTINIPEIPGLTFTLENVFDEYAFEPGRMEEVELFPVYKFFFPNHGTISCNQDIEIHIAGSTMRNGSPVSIGDTRSLKKGEKIELNHKDAGWDAPEGKEFIFAISVYLEGAQLWFVENDDGVYTLFESDYQGSEIAKPISELAASTPTSPADTPSSWAVEQVNAAIAAGVVPEALQSKYTQATTRAEFCALAVALYETATGKTITERTAFSDTTDVNVEKMAALGVVNGIGDGKFGPKNKLTREQAATMLSRLATAIGKPLTEQAPAFADNTSISSWAIESVGQIQAAGIMSGVGDNTFSPATDYTREQSIITIMRLFNYMQ